MAVEEGTPAPDFALTSDTGETVSLSSLRGQARRPLFLSQGRHARVHEAGVRHPRRLGRVRAERRRRARRQPRQRGLARRSSSRSSTSRSRCSPIPTTATAEAYGVWVEKSMYGKTYMGVERSTFVIDADGHAGEGDAEGQARDARRRRARGARASARRRKRRARTRRDVAPSVKRGPAGPRSHMRMRGLEPPRPERHTDLNRARLPIPPHPRADDSSRRHTLLACCTETAAPDRRHTHHDPRFRTPLRPRPLLPARRRRGGRRAPRPGGRRARSSSRSPRRRSPAGRAPPGARRARPSIASRHGSPPRSARRIPDARIRWRYRLVLNGAAVVVPTRADPAAPRPSRRDGGRLAARPTRVASTTAAEIASAASDVADRASRTRATA